MYVYVCTYTSLSIYIYVHGRNGKKEEAMNEVIDMLQQNYIYIYTYIHK